MIPRPAHLLCRSRNTLDKALHARAEEILIQNRKRWAGEGLMESLPKLAEPPPSAARPGTIMARFRGKFPFPKPLDPKPEPGTNG